MSSNSFALTIGEQYLRTIDCDIEKNHITVKAAAFDIYESNVFSNNNNKIDTNLANKIIRLINDSGINKKQVNIVIPDTYSYSRIIEMPLLSDKELISAIKYQADQFIPIPIDDLDLDAITLFKDKGKSRQYILIVACAKAIVDRMAKLSETANLIPISVENETSASMRLFKQLYSTVKSKEKFTIFINFGINSSTLILYNTINNYPTHMYNFNLGLKIFEKDFKANYSLDDTKINEIFQTIGFDNSNQSFQLENILSSPLKAVTEEIYKFSQNIKDKLSISSSCIYLFGEGNTIKNLDSQLSKAINIPVRIIDISLMITQNTVANFFKDDWPIFISAIGGTIE